MLDRLEHLKIQKNLFDILVSIVIGLLCGLGAVALKTMLGFFTHLFWGHHEAGIEVIQHASKWRILLIPALGGLLVGPIIHFFAREAKGHGVPEVMAAVAVNNGVIRLRVALAKAVSSALTIASGGSAGREGPIIQIGSAIGSGIGQFLKVSSTRLRTFVGCGAAAGIAATFNAPIAGALFSVEVILREFGVSQFSPIVIAAVLATTVSRHFFGDAAVFQIPHYEMVSAWEYIPYALLGIVCAFVAVGFTKLLYMTEDFFDAQPKIPGWLKPAIGGILLGFVGLLIPEVFGDGQEGINLALLDEWPVKVLCLLLVGKLLATCLTLGSGGSGGVFAPSLFLGAIVGALLGKAFGHWGGDLIGPAGGYALCAMGGVVAGTTHAPITAILIIFEITDNYTIILPLMTVCIISTVLSQRLSHESIYTTKLLRRGLNIFKRQPIDLLKAHTVGEAMMNDYEAVYANASAKGVLKHMIHAETTQFYVLNEDGAYQGLIRIEDVRRLMIDHTGLEDVLLADDLAVEDIPVCYEDDNLSQCLTKFERSGLSELPVVQHGPLQMIQGVIRYRDVLARYNAELVKHESSEALASRLISSSTHKVRIVAGYSMIDWEPPSFLWGKTLAESQLGRKYSVYVILVKRSVDDDGKELEPIVPNHKFVIQQGDMLVIYGSDEDIERAKHI